MINIGNLTFYMGPTEVGGPDDLKKPIIDFINAAQKRLYIAVQELDCQEIAEAIVEARKRKVLVKMVLEGDYLKSHSFRTTPGGKHEINRELHNQVLRANINVKTDYNTNIFHQKFMIRDSKAVLTGSTNFTDTGVSRNLNHVVVVEDEKVAKIYNKEFSEIMKGHFGKLNVGHDPVPAKVNVSGVPVKVLFAPDHNPEMEIMKQMEKSQKRVDFAIFTFAQSSGIDDTIALLRRAGVPVRGIFDAKQGNQEWAASRVVANAGAEAFLAKNKPDTPDYPNKLGKLHHKLMVVDEQLIIAGSFNYTGPATKLNDENIIIIGDLHETDPTSVESQKKIARSVLDEIDRIILEYGQKVD